MPSSQGNRVCVKMCTECKAANHVGQVELEDFCFYVCPRKDQVLVGNCLPKSFLTDDAVNSILSTKQNVELWFSYFDRVKDADAWEKLGTPTSQVTLEEAVKGHEDLKSPRAVRLSELIEHMQDVEDTISDFLKKPKELERLTDFIEEKGEIPLSLEDVVKKLVASWDKIQANFDSLDKQDKDTQAEVGSLKKVLEEVSKTAEDKFSLIDSKAHIILNLIGNDDVASDHGEKSLWTAIRGLIKDFSKLKSELDSKLLDLETRVTDRCVAAENKQDTHAAQIALNEDYLDAFKQEFEVQLSKIHRVMSGFADEMKKDSRRGTGMRPDAGGVMGHISQLEANIRKVAVDLESQINSLNSKVDRLSARGRVGLRVQTGSVGDAMGSMRARASEWEGGFGDMSTIRETTFEKTSMDELRERSARGLDEDQLEKMEEDIGKLKDFVSELQKRVKGDGYSSLQFHFNSEEEAMEFLERTNFDVGWMWDLYSALVCATQKKLEGKELSDWRHATQKVGVSKRQTQIESSMQSLKPKLLFGEKDGDPQPLKEGMGNIKSYDIWGAGHEPFKNTITKKLSSFVKSVVGDLPKNEKNPDKLEGIVLAKSLLVAVEAQWTALSGFIDSAYNDLTQQANFSKKTAWLLTGRYVAAVFDAMRSVRDAASNLDDPTTLASRTTIFWAVLQCHRIMQEFIDEDFKGHPLIVKETSFYTLMDRISEEDLDGVKRKFDQDLEVIRKRVKYLEDENRAKTRTIDDLHGKYSTIVNQYNQLKDKVAAMDKRINPVDLVTVEDSVTKEADGTLRGLASGRVEDSGELLPCVVFGERFPVWLPILRQLGYRPVLVFLRTTTYLTEVEAVVPEGCVVISGQHWKIYQSGLPVLFTTFAGFVDGRPSAEILHLATKMSVKVVYGIGAPRKALMGWQIRRVSVDHHFVGGVTTGRHHLVACFTNQTGLEHLHAAPLRSRLTRDMSTVLDATAELPTAGRHGPVFTRAPEQSEHLGAYEVRNVGSQENPVYHGGGWLPPDPSPTIRVKTRSVFIARDKNRWVTRSLVAKEYLYAHDWSDTYVNVMSRSNKRARLDEKRRKREEKDKEVGKESIPVADGDEGAKMETKEVVASRKELDEGSPEDTVDKVTREKRERKATKADDAAVPIELWTEHYFEEIGVTPSELEYKEVENAMEILRNKFFIWVWKKKLMREFSRWIEVSKDESKATGISAVKIEGPFRQSDVFYRYRQEGKELRSRWYWKYRWDEEGRSRYQAWYHERSTNRNEDLIAGVDGIQRACRSTWWEWTDGSRPFHWRWPEWYRSTIRDGLEVHLQGLAPTYHVAQADEKDPQVKERVKKKLSKVRARRYIAEGYVVSLTSFFSVPKGESDIRMVYDGTKSGLNQAMWVPRFGLPTIDTHLRSIEEGTFLADVDVGDCFLNFPLHEKLQALAGVDLTCYFPNPDGSKVWECWHRALMGVKSSPYQAVQGMSVVEEVIRGNPKDETNVFRWKRVRLNCPGSSEYDPSKPWISKVREDDVIAADLVGYVDDLRPSGNGRAEAWAAARRTASIMNYLGIQDAARKRRDSSRTPGAWAGSVVVTREDGVYVLTDVDKWNKAKAMVEEVLEMVKANPNRMDRKRLESIRGFLIYVVRTYPPLKPYIMGLHLTIDGWRDTRDDEGWRLTQQEVEAKFVTDDNDDHVITTQSKDAPRFVEAKPRLREDMLALQKLMKAERPILRRVRSKKGRKAIYVFGDASEAGFGRTIAVDGVVYYQYGQWDGRSNGKSSNWREAQNLLDGIERAAKDYALGGLEMFIFTDNSTAEGAFWKGTSQSKLIASIVLKMRQLEMDHDLIIHVTHVSGTRMIKQGTDGLSRADQSTGVMAGEKMEAFIPLDQTALDRSATLKKQLRSHLKEFKFRILKPEQWFDEYHDYGNYIWAPPPAAADAVVDLLNKARHKRPESMHLVFVPRLMTGRWRKHMTRLADYYFRFDWQGSWDLKNNYWRTWTGHCNSRTCRRFLTYKNGIFCANFCAQRGRFAPCRSAHCPDCLIPLGHKPFVVRETMDKNGEEIVEREDGRYKKARLGDSFMVPYQCDLCQFRNIMKRDPWRSDPNDKEIQEFIRRATLDAFWSRETSTVKANYRLLIRAEEKNSTLKMPPLIQDLGPFPLDDVFGMQAAIAILMRSLDPGKYEQFVQWETFRKTRSAITNAHQASVRGMNDVVGAYEKNKCWITQVPTHSFWFTRFMEGIHRRVGEVVKQDWPIPVKVVKYIDETLNELWSTLTNSREKLKTAQMGAWFLIGFCMCLRGEEMLMIELAGTADRLRHLLDEDEPYFEVRIRGRTKSIQLAGYSFGLPCVAVTGGTQLQPGRWVKRLVDTVHSQGRRTGRLFERDLVVPRLVEFEDDWLSVLEHVQSTTNLIEDRVNLREEAGILRSLRRGVNSHAKNQRIEEPLIHAFNRWRSEKGGEKKSGIPMPDRYTELGTLTPTFLRFSKAL